MHRSNTALLAVGLILVAYLLCPPFLLQVGLWPTHENTSLNLYLYWFLYPSWWLAAHCPPYQWILDIEMRGLGLMRW